MQQHQTTARKPKRPVISEQDEQFIRMVHERIGSFNGDNSERDQGHYDGLVECLYIWTKAQVNTIGGSS